MYWKCEYIFSDGHKEWKMMFAKTSVRAFKRAYEVGRYIGAEPDYGTLQKASKAEIAKFVKSIKNNIGK